MLVYHHHGRRRRRRHSMWTIEKVYSKIKFIVSAAFGFPVEQFENVEYVLRKREEMREKDSMAEKGKENQENEKPELMSLRHGKRVCVNMHHACHFYEAERKFH